MIELVSPEFILATAMILTHGAKKYDAENWRKGIKYKRIYGGIQRHLLAWFNGENNDPDSGCPHLWHASCGLMFLITYDMHDRYRNFDDRPNMDTSPETLKKYLHIMLGKDNV